MNMRLLLICFLLTIAGFINAQDTSCWKIMLNQKIIQSGNLKKPQQLTLSSKEKGNLKLIFKGDKHPEKIIRTFLIMNQDRNELFRLIEKNKNNFVLISIDKIKELNASKPVDIYTIYTPKDSLQARTWRIKPLLLTTISWQ